jgi:hypothetical protein
MLGRHVIPANMIELLRVINLMLECTTIQYPVYSLPSRVSNERAQHPAMRQYKAP